MTRTITMLLTAATALPLLAGASAAQDLRAPRGYQRMEEAPPATRPQQSHFYPQSSNTAFENQLRKFSDPLAANGAK